jgi:hypothetical protein
MISDCEVGDRRRQPVPTRPGWRPTDSGKRVVGQFEWSRPQISSGYLQEFRQMWLFIQTWLPLLGFILTASVCFAAASFFMAQARPQRR